MIGPRLRAMIIKELLAILRDPKSRLILIAPPLMQFFLFSFASTMEVNNIRIGIYDLDGGRWSREIVERLDASPNVREVRVLSSDAALKSAVDHQDVIAVLRFDQQFSADVAAGRPATIGGVFDGRRSNAAQIVSGYVQRIVADVSAETPRGIAIASRGGGASSGTVVRHWFNPNLEYIWFVMPALISIIAAISSMTLVSQSVARERELGTFDQLLVSPLRTHEVLIGKMLPPMGVGLINVAIFVVLTPLVFGVPVEGSLLLFLVALVFYLLSLVGIGMLISVVSATQQQAFLGMFALTVPMIILSGYASPVDNMPEWLQVITWANPPTWFLVIAEGTFLKGMPVGDVLNNTWPLAVLAALSLWAAWALFRSRLE
ncbi:ABC transporter permease [Croceicoccus naphthovorans]|uniref:Transport permease protein n=1 Tax=Croceicoccus naphthovorans TaxID=1348774 RepID=A0A0G3XD48_9SPHN|nr:ABC transporter permease [Croceicoccus naphthovorans]AKM09505.1 membrane protein [Croceicoccus naphthovorans]MBB3989759.1 ABC-2 type transport system permease protein [Croceicoccus naphthovorans]